MDRYSIDLNNHEALRTGDMGMVIGWRYSSFFSTSWLSREGKGVIWSIIANNTGLITLDKLSDADWVLLVPLIHTESSSLLCLRRASSLAHCTHLHLFTASSITDVQPNQHYQTILLLPPWQCEGPPVCTALTAGSSLHPSEAVHSMTIPQMTFLSTGSSTTWNFHW